MKNVLLLFVHFVSIVIRLIRPAGTKTVLAESLLLKHQLILLNRSRKRAPNLSPLDRFLLGLWTPLINPGRLAQNAVIVKPSTLLRLHEVLVKAKYRLLFSSRRKRKPGPKGPSEEIIRERLIGTIRREYLDHVLFWGEIDLARKLEEFRVYYNKYRVHSALNGETPSGMSGHPVLGGARLDAYQWRSHCRGRFQTPMAA